MSIYYPFVFFTQKKRPYPHREKQIFINDIKELKNVCCIVAWLLLYIRTNNDYYFVVPQYITLINKKKQKQ